MSVATGIPIFDGSISDWNDLQVQFISWCVFYHNVFYEMVDRPDNKTIEDDRLLDLWLQQKRIEKNAAERKARMDNVKYNNGGGLSGESEVFEF